MVQRGWDENIVMRDISDQNTLCLSTNTNFREKKTERQRKKWKELGKSHGKGDLTKWNCRTQVL